MYIYNAFNQAPPIVPLAMEAFVAPADFDPDAQELNIVTAFAAYNDVNKKYIFSVGTSATTILPGVTSRSYAYSENDGPYTVIDSGTVTWTSGSTKRHVIVIDSTSIPARIPITAVWAYFSNAINSIGSDENNSTIKYLHFENLNSLTSIPMYAFRSAINLTGNLTIPNSLNYITDVSFYECHNLIGDLIIPSSINSIGTYAFYNCGFTSVQINYGLTWIKDFAFCACIYLTGNLTIPNSVVTIGGGAFQYCRNLTGDLTIPNSVITIGASAFESCYGMKGSLTISSSVTVISANSFRGCLFSGPLNIPQGVTSIGFAAFYESTGFTNEINIPSTVTAIDQWAFGYVFRPTKVNCFNAVPPIINANSFGGINPTLHVPSGSLTAYQASPYWSAFTNIIADL